MGVLETTTTTIVYNNESNVINSKDNNVTFEEDDEEKQYIKNQTDPGFQYIKLPYKWTYEEEEKMIDEARTKLNDLLIADRQEWPVRMSNVNNVKITSTLVDGERFTKTKGITDLVDGITLDDIKNQYKFNAKNSDSINRWMHMIDPVCVQMHILTKIQNKELLLNDDDDKNELIQLQWGVFNGPPMVSPRDFVYIQHLCDSIDPITNERLFVTNNYSIKLPTEEVIPSDMYKTTGRIRAHIYATGYIFRENIETKRVSLAYILQGDPGGWLPISVVNIVSLGQALNVGRIRDVYTTYHEVSQILNCNNTPLECYKLSSRDGKRVHKVKIPQNIIGNNDETTTCTIRICAYSERPITMLVMKNEFYNFSATDNTTCSANNNGNNKTSIQIGEEIEFGGGSSTAANNKTEAANQNNVLDISIQISPSSTFATSVTEDKTINMSSFQLQFRNTGRKNTTLYVNDSIL